MWSLLHFFQSAYSWLFGGHDTRLTGLQVWLSIPILMLYTIKNPKKQDLQKHQRKRHQKNQTPLKRWQQRRALRAHKPCAGFLQRGEFHLYTVGLFTTIVSNRKSRWKKSYCSLTSNPFTCSLAGLYTCSTDIYIYGIKREKSKYTQSKRLTDYRSVFHRLKKKKVFKIPHLHSKNSLHCANYREERINTHLAAQFKYVMLLYPYH